MIAQDNPEMRNEALQWIMKNKDEIKKCDAKEMVKPIIQCL
jgi:hypothetical protein